MARIIAVADTFDAMTSNRPYRKGLALPVDIPGYQVRQQWHERMQRDPGHAWLRKLIATLFKSA